jgi:hypothetical protein
MSQSPSVSLPGWDNKLPQTILFQRSRLFSGTAVNDVIKILALTHKKCYVRFSQILTTRIKKRPLPSTAGLPFKTKFNYVSGNAEPLQINTEYPCLCGLVVRVPGYKSRSTGFDSQRYQIFWEVVGLERGPLRLVSIIEELLERKSNGSGLESREYGRRNPSHWPCGTLPIHKSWH